MLTSLDLLSIPPSLDWTCVDMMKVKEISHVQISPDGQQVFFVTTEANMNENKSEYVDHLYLAPVASLQDSQCVLSCLGFRSPQWSPKDFQIAFLAPDSAGNNQIWLMDLHQQVTHPLTHIKGKITTFKWSPNGQQIAFTLEDALTEQEEESRQNKNDAYVVEEKVKMNRLWMISIQPNGIPQLLTPLHLSVSLANNWMGGGGYDWSPDSQRIVVTCTPISQIEGWKQSFLALVDVQSKQLQTLVRRQAAEFNPVYSPDGKWIAYIASQGSPKWPLDFRVFVIAAQGGQPRSLAPTTDAFPTKIIGWSPDSQNVYVTENERTFQRLLALPLDGKASYSLTPNNVVFSSLHLNASKTLLGFVLEGLNSPPEAYITSLPDFKPIQVSQVNQECLKYTPIQTTHIQWASTDGFPIEGLLTYPTSYQPGKKYPLVLIIHGGPLAAFYQNYVGSPSTYGPVAVLAHRDCFVLRCNVRGSTGYGKKFRHANVQDWAGRDYQDLMTGVDHVIQKGLVDENRLGVLGWSYGGYMASWVIARTNRFKAAVIGAGIANCIGFVASSDIPSFLPDYFGCQPWEDAHTYMKYSPLFHLKQVSTPTLIQHGEEDRRVPIAQSYELYHALKQKRVPVQMVVYPRTAHYPQEPKLMFDLMNRRINWFVNYLNLDK